MDSPPRKTPPTGQPGPVQGQLAAGLGPGSSGGQLFSTSLCPAAPPQRMPLRNGGSSRKGKSIKGQQRSPAFVYL